MPLFVSVLMIFSDMFLSSPLLFLWKFRNQVSQGSPEKTRKSWLKSWISLHLLQKIATPKQGAQWKASFFPNIHCRFFHCKKIQISIQWPQWNTRCNTKLTSPQLVYNLDVSENSGNPQIIHFNRVFHYKHYKPSILGYPYFWKHPSAVCCHCSTVQTAVVRWWYVWGGNYFGSSKTRNLAAALNGNQRWFKTWLERVGESLKMATKDGPRGLILLDSCILVFSRICFILIHIFK